ncbi:efflux RND transporter permease subunit [Aliikangiella coralliicola]|uniref:RND family transporter n=1 Tax=Aliikangiella coralliicola TaxID=2592383 RepID=A0A545TWC0_9GAMM|nr:MMPL family transporter [Aliikangiella coralliicola]TQV81513.1 RND family transporter [Aliikangiella coralliicola]
MSRINLDDLIKKWIFRRCKTILWIFGLITAAMLYFASQLKVDASFEKNIPLEHEYMKTYIKHQEHFGGANRVLVVLEDKSGDIFNQQFFEALQDATHRVAAISSVSEPLMNSLFTPNTRFVEAVEDGMVGGPVIPASFDGSPQQLQLVRSNALKAGLVGRLVANNFGSAMVSAQLLSIDPKTKQKTDLVGVADHLEQIRTDMENKYDNIEVHIIGFSKMIGDVSNGAKQVVMFFAIAFVITAILVFLYSHSVSLTVLPLLCSVVAVIWQLGLLTALGFGLDPMSILVPFLVFAIGVSHGVQMINAVGKNVAAGTNSSEAAYGACCRLFVPGMIALMSDTIGFLTLLFIKIDIIKELAITASLGVAVIILTNLILLPVLLSYAKFPANFAEKVEQSSKKQAVLWKFFSGFAQGRTATKTIVVAVLIVIVSIFFARDMKVGDLHAGAPALRQDSVYNLDTKFVTENFSIGTDMISIIVETIPDGCTSFEIMNAIDKFQWNLENLSGVQSAISLPTVSKILNAGFYEGALQWRILPREQATLVQSIRYLETSSGLFNSDCSVIPVLVFTKDHKAETIQQVVDAAKAYAAEHKTENVTYRLATGPVGVMAATNEAVSNAQIPMLIWVYLAVILLCLISFRSIRSTLCIVIPLAIVSLMAQALMSILDIGLTVATLPVVALGVGIGVDYGIYIFSRMIVFIRAGESISEAFLKTLNLTGNAVFFTGLTLAIGVSTWLMSVLQFQAEMGILLTFMFLFNMLGAVILLPALATVFYRR